MALFGKKNNGQDSSDGSVYPTPAGVSEAKDPSAPAPAAPAQDQAGGAPGFQPRPGSPAAAKPSPAGDKPAAPAMGAGTSQIGALCRRYGSICASRFTGHELITGRNSGFAKRRANPKKCYGGSEEN